MDSAQNTGRWGGKDEGTERRGAAADGKGWSNREGRHREDGGGGLKPVGNFKHQDTEDSVLKHVWMVDATSTRDHMLEIFSNLHMDFTLLSLQHLPEKFYKMEKCLPNKKKFKKL